MEELKRKVKELVSAEKKTQVDEVFRKWLSELKVYTIHTKGDLESSDDETEDEKQRQLKEMKNRIAEFKHKLDNVEDFNAATLVTVAKEVKCEIEKISEEISNIKIRSYSKAREDWELADSPLIKKLEEIKDLLEKLK